MSAAHSYLVGRFEKQPGPGASLRSRSQPYPAGSGARSWSMSENVPTPPRVDCVARTLALIAEYSPPDALVRARLGGSVEDGSAADQPMTRERAAASERTPSRLRLGEHSTT